MTDEPPPISLSQARSGITQTPDHRDRQKDRTIKEGEAEQVELEGRRKYFSLRSQWSGAIIRWISVLIAGNILFVTFAGLGWFDFKPYKWLITSVTVESFLQIVGLGYIAVKFLFSDKGV